MKIHPAVTHISSPIFDETSEIYLIRSERNAIIDTGIQESPQNDIAPALGKLGLTFADIDLILNTHGHPDHTGGNAHIKNASNAQILIHSNDVSFVQDHDQSYDLHIAPVSEVILGKDHLEEDKALFLEMAGPDVEVDRPLDDNDMIHLGDECELRVIHLPGHTSGCVGFYWEKEGILFGGDSLPGLHTENRGLPIISDFPAYEKTLDRVRELSVQILLQSHPFRGLSLPPSPMKKDEEVEMYLQECQQIAGWIIEAVKSVYPDATDKPFIELADDIISSLPKETDFKPMSQVPPPRYNALTILSAIKHTGL